MRILISGTPGTGKTEVADALGKFLGFKVVHLSDLIDKYSIGSDKKRDTKIVDEDKLSDYLKKFDNVIIETHLPVKLDSRCFVLKCGIKELRERLRRRNWNKKKIDENIQAEIFEVCSDDMREQGYEIIEVDTTGKSASEIAEKIKCIVGL